MPDKTGAIFHYRRHLADDTEGVTVCPKKTKPALSTKVAEVRVTGGRCARPPPNKKAGPTEPAELQHRRHEAPHPLQQYTRELARYDRRRTPWPRRYPTRFPGGRPPRAAPLGLHKTRYRPPDRRSKRTSRQAVDRPQIILRL